ncbi:hypothetical protein CO033_01545 [Candidatus Nomurabacteria bacterium CG_4_9_14_0_2_um_filter_32_10]|uniref:Uncharacterized protein n=2 Tax=Candidatus Nomuraibacteriota TaxID=1752729 RepID=A0A2H0CGL0_9BACT|nr:MAG: hypothetical protein COW91_02040 [Candidatus Nomurabacteria bacterium CG22_combo_CG10-13_8_21_14_all_32_8]PJC49434.1 MAG: hypothetical protein CO033_01545 [Candidatus Nomurabacteria bacterium CG_4_9_14_0_2_um_filter_32_10]
MGKFLFVLVMFLITFVLTYSYLDSNYPYQIQVKMVQTGEILDCRANVCYRSEIGDTILVLYLEGSPQRAILLKK